MSQGLERGGVKGYFGRRRIENMVILEKKKIRNAVMQEMQSLQVKGNY